MSVTPQQHRDAARQFASGVTVAAAGHGGVYHAITATAFCSLSLDPPLVLLAVRSGSRLLELARASGSIGISVLGAHQRHVGEWAATSGRPPERSLPLHATTTGATGAPLVPDALAWFDCTVESTAEHGDHHVVVGRVVACGVGDGGEPLLYARAGYHALGRLLSPPAPDGEPTVPGEPGGITLEDQVGG